ncbi:MAG TPA: DUF4012 domain-containing protein [Candidatus Paceibacterota bacterium]|nr:DUF4012 domain-containing protein [Candidatus Paceibacterota bacterium]HOK97365.1 DUF4012 domain-containing protein [Candidatus Paceibacterota bacterium]HPP64870.1 DUF4012 domain-containing protein [Candidatus Paceibacterota bacterium]
MRLIKKISFLFLILALLGGIFYLGDYVTKLRYSNKKVLNSLEEQSKTQNLQGISSLSEELGRVKEGLTQTKGELEKFINLIPRLKEDVKLKETLTAIIDNLDCLDNLTFILDGLNQKEDSLICLKNLYNSFKDLEKLNVSFGKNYQQDISTILDFLGDSQKKNYLVLLQYPFISRPTGGLFASYGILSIDKGKINFSGNHISDLDNIFVSKIIPPEPLQAISNQWFFHDLGWFYDFDFTAKKIIQFYEENTQDKIDGVILINPETIANIMEVVGEIKLEDYSLAITANNFSEFLKEQLETGFKPGPSRLSPLILDDFFTLIFEKLKTQDPEKITNLIDNFQSQILEKDIQFYFKDEKFNQYFSRYLEKETNQTDYSNFLAVTFSLIDKELKTDTRLKKIILKTEITEEGKFINQLIVNAEARTSADRKNLDYLKIYLPEGVEILKVEGLTKVNKEDNSKYYEKLNYAKDSDLNLIEQSKIIMEEENAEIYKENGKLVIGGFAYLSKTPVNLDYVLPFSLQKENLPQLVETNIYRQSGQSVNFLYKIILPSELRLSPTLFSFEKWIPLDKDLNIKVNIEKNEPNF